MIKTIKKQTAHLRAAMALVVVLLAFGGVSSTAWADNHHPVSLQFFHSVATSPDPDTSTNFRLALLYGRSGDINGFDLTGAASVTGGDFSGIQLTGLYSQVRGSFRGLSLNAGVQHHKSRASGLQVSGLANVHQDLFTGVQMAGSLNYSHRGFQGVQISALMNLNDSHGSFLQTSAIANVNVKTYSGLQLAGIMNFTGQETRGAQLALLNFAVEMSGAQVGVVNLAQNFSGLQAGIVNISNQIEGTPFGVVNLTNDGEINALAYASNLGLYNLGLRTVVNQWSSVLSLGYSDVSSGDDVAKNSGFLGWNFGRQVPLSEKLILTLDAGYLHIIPQDYEEPEINDEPHYALQLRAFVDVSLGDSVALFGGGGLSTIFSEYTTHARSHSEGNVFGGISLF